MPTRLQSAFLEALFDLLEGTPGLTLRLRRQPRGFAGKALHRLVGKLDDAPPLPLALRFPGCPPRLRLVGSPDVTGLSYAKRNSIHVLRFVNDQMNRPAGVAAPEPKLINRTSVELLRGCSVPPSRWA
jgi:hypothetical protein